MTRRSSRLRGPGVNRRPPPPQPARAISSSRRSSPGRQLGGRVGEEARDDPVEVDRERLVHEAELRLRAGGIEERHPAARERREEERVEPRARARDPRARRRGAARPRASAASRLEQLAERRRLVLREVPRPAERLRVPEDGQDELHDRARVDVADAALAAAGQQHRAAVEQPPEVALDAAEVVALAVHHRDAQPRRGEAAPRPRLGERVLERALAHPVVPLTLVEGVERRGHQRAVVVALARRPRPAFLAHEVDLAGADDDVVADASVEDLRRPAAVAAVVRGEVHGRVPLAAGEEAARSRPSCGRRAAARRASRTCRGACRG